MKKFLLIVAFTLFGFSLFTNHVNAQINPGLLNQMTNKAQTLNNALGVSRDVKDSSGIDKYIGNVIGTILSFAGVIFLVLIIIAGYTWITAQGSDEKITKAKQYLTNGVIGIAISFGAFIIISSVISPLSKKYLTPPQQSTNGTGGEVTIIPCNNEAQCADQATRQLCISGNCLECNVNDNIVTGGENWSTKCKNYYDDAKPVCDLINSICVPSLTAPCQRLTKNACLIRSDCRLDHKIDFKLINICAEKGVVYIGSPKGNSCEKYGPAPTCSQHQECEWLTGVKDYYTDSFCKKKEDYKCSAQCQGDKTFCLSSVSPAKCVECRDDNDCAGNLLDKKCSISTGNFICVPF